MWYAFAMASCLLLQVQVRAQEMDLEIGEGEEIPTAAVMAAAIIVMLIVLALSIAVMAVVAYMLYLCYSRIPAPHRQMEPTKVFLLLIPCFNLVWNFYVYPGLAKSYQSYFRSVGRTDVGDCGEKLGLWFSIAMACSIVPLLNYIAGPIALVLLIIFLIKAFELRKQIPEVVTTTAPGM
jgi:hypothetical protein